MPYPTIFHLISAITNKEGVRCVLIGGFAVNYYKVTRQTIDVDFLTTKEDFNKISDLLKKAGFELGYSKETFIAKQKFIVQSLNSLIALKLHAIKYNQKLRVHKDFPDIINLIRVNKVNYKSKEFRELCLKYGTEELYNKILSEV